MATIAQTNGLVTINGLNETAIQMREELMMLPMVYQGDELRRMGVDLIGNIQNKLTTYNFIRYGGLMRPYYPGMTASKDAIAKIEENTLQVYLAAGIHEDNIQNYTQFALGDINLLGTNKTYKNPMEALILMSVMRTWSEDLLDAFMFAARKDEGGTTKYDVFDGIYTLITKAKTAGKLVAGKNLIKTGAIVKPTSKTDTEAFDKVNEFLMQANPALVRNGALLLVTSQFASWYQEALANRFSYVVKPDEYGNFEIPAFNKVRMVPCQNMGTGDLMILTKPNNLQLGFDSQSDDEYVRVRNIKDDANIVTYNIQARYGANIRSFDPKMFAVNDGSLTAYAWSGDVQPATTDSGEEG